MQPIVFAEALLALPAMAWAAPITIDSFESTGFQVLSAPSLGGSPTNPTTDTLATTDAIGGQRTITNTRLSPTGTANAFGAQVQTVVTTGFASVDLGSNTAGTSSFSWDAGGANLVAGINNGLFVDVLSTNQPGVTFTFTIGGQGVTRTANGMGRLDFAFVDFMGVDFTNVGAIALTIGGPAAFSTDFDNVRADANRLLPNPSPVPLPAGLPFLLAGLCGLGLLRRATR